MSLNGLMGKDLSKNHYDALCCIEKLSDDALLLDEQAEKWYYEQGNLNIPLRGTPEWDKMYNQWLAYSFNKWSEK